MLRALRDLLRQRPAPQRDPLLDRILQRRSCRRFRPDPVPREDLDRVLEVARFAPSTANMQLWTFISMDAARWREVTGVPMPFFAPHGVLVCADLHRNAALFEDPGAPLTLFTMATLNVGIAAQTLCLAAEALGYATIHLSDDGRAGLMDARLLRERLALPQGVVPLVTVLLGRPAVGGVLPVVPPRLPRSAVVGEGAYPTDLDGARAWADQMRVGGRLTHLRGGLSGKLRYYSKKMEDVERLLHEQLHP